MNLAVTIEIPMLLPSLANISGHWTKIAKIKKNQKNLVHLFMSPYVHIFHYMKHYNIKMTRISPRQLDPDNLISAFKAITDAVASFLRPGLKPGRADGLDCFTFSYDQEKGKPSVVKIEIT